MSALCRMLYQKNKKNNLSIINTIPMILDLTMMWPMTLRAPVCTPWGWTPSHNTREGHNELGIRKIPDGKQVIQIITPSQCSHFISISQKVPRRQNIGVSGLMRRIVQTRIMLSSAYWFNSFPFLAASCTLSKQKVLNICTWPRTMNLNMNQVQGTQ